MRVKAGAKEYVGHTYMDLARFDDITRHMIVFDVLNNDSPVGYKGDRMRLYLSDRGLRQRQLQFDRIGEDPLAVRIFLR